MELVLCTTNCLIAAGNIGNEYFIVVGGECLVVLQMEQHNEGTACERLFDLKSKLMHVEGDVIEDLASLFTVATITPGNGIGEAAFLELDSRRSASIVAGRNGAR